MKRIFCAALIALSLLMFSPSRQSTAQTQQSADGRFSFTDEDGVARYVEFSAVGDGSGKGSGRMIYNDTSRIPDEDYDGDPPPRPADSPTEFYVTAEFDAVTIEKNRAVMTGVVRESSHKSYLGRLVQLVVEDNAEYPRMGSDRLSWVFCRPMQSGWVPSDAERKDDDGAYLSWWATDAERRDDVGIPSRPAYSPEATNGCPSYTLPAYDYLSPYKWEGDIVVRP